MKQIKCFRIILEDIKSLKQTRHFRINLEDTEITERNGISQNYSTRDEIVEAGIIFRNKFGGYKNHWKK